MTYSVSRKADRHAMAQELAELVRTSGFEAQINLERADGFHDRRVNVCVTGMPHGLRLTVDFEPIRGLNSELGFAQVLSWHGVRDGFRLNPNIFHSVNNFHGHKATDGIDTFDQLKFVLAKRLRLIAAGEAFRPERQSA